MSDNKKKTIQVELNEDQIDEILGCLDGCVGEGLAGDKAILLARYFRDRYNIDLDSYIWLQGKLRNE